MIRDQIIQKVEKLNAAIDELEEQHYQFAKSKQVEHIFEGKEKTNKITRWLLHLQSPKVAAPDWHQDQTRMELHHMLATGEDRSTALSAQLNVYVLNAAIKLARLKGDRYAAQLAEELRQLAEGLRKQ